MWAVSFPSWTVISPGKFTGGEPSAYGAHTGILPTTRLTRMPHGQRPGAHEDGLAMSDMCFICPAPMFTNLPALSRCSSERNPPRSPSLSPMCRVFSQGWKPRPGAVPLLPSPTSVFTYYHPRAEATVDGKSGV